MVSRVEVIPGKHAAASNNRAYSVCGIDNCSSRIRLNEKQLLCVTLKL